jgi:hypothetical protein
VELRFHLKAATTGNLLALKCGAQVVDGASKPYSEYRLFLKWRRTIYY